MIFFSGITADDVDKVWSIVKPMVAAALVHESNFCTDEDIYNSVRARKMQLWVAADDGNIVACMVSEIVEYPRTKVAHIVVLGGDSIASWISARDQWELFELWAGRMGCKYIEAHARPGIGKLTKEIGLFKHGEIIRKELFPNTLQ